MIDYKAVFNILPSNFGVMAPDPPHFTILAANKAFLASTGHPKEEVLGKPLFQAYPENPDSDGGAILIFNSFMRVMKTKREDKLGIVRYDVPVKDTDTFITKYWSLTHIPLLDEKGEIQYIVQAPIDITHLVDIGLRV